MPGGRPCRGGDERPVSVAFDLQPVIATLEEKEVLADERDDARNLSRRRTPVAQRLGDLGDDTVADFVRERANRQFPLGSRREREKRKRTEPTGPPHRLG